MTNTIAIKTNNLSKAFKNRVAVNKLNIEINKGEIYSLLGTNGAGKTTTIKMLSCLLSPSSGGASILNYNIRNDKHLIKGIIGVSPQETAIAEHLSSIENLLLIGGIFGLKTNENKNRAKKLMKLMEIEDRKDQARKLSGGLKRRLSIAMSLMSDPQILFLDEPTLGLDPQSRRSVWDYIKKLKNEKTILLTTHYLEEADALADRIAIMDQGAIIASGTPTELKKNLSNHQTLQIKGDNLNANLTQTLTNMGLKADVVNHTLEIKGHEIDFYSIIDHLKKNNIVINSIKMNEPTLDDVFLKLTEKEVTV